MPSTRAGTGVYTLDVVGVNVNAKKALVGFQPIGIGGDEWTTGRGVDVDGWTQETVGDVDVVNVGFGVDGTLGPELGCSSGLASRCVGQ